MTHKQRDSRPPLYPPLGLCQAEKGGNRAAQLPPLPSRTQAKGGIQGGFQQTEFLLTFAAAMHIPDGFLDSKTLITTGTLAAGGVGVAWKEAKSHIPPGRIPLLGMSAAFIFAAQMLNFPVAFGTSGHLIGSVLAAVLLGPGPAIIVMSTVLVVQCFLMADGGMLALGANIFNMAIVGTVSGYGIYRIILLGMPGRTGIAIFAASWGSVVLASLCCAGELAWSGAAPVTMVFPAMAGVHALIGVGEGLITAAIYYAVRRVRPDLLDQSAGPAKPVLSTVLFGCIVAAGLVIFVLPFASKLPDGLEHVAHTLGFDQRAVNPQAPAGVPGTTELVAGLVGLALVFVLTVSLVRIATGKSHKHPPHSA